MKAIHLILAAMLLSAPLSAQTISDSGHRTVGFIKSDGTIQNSSYRTIAYADDVTLEWAALFFFFHLN